MTKADDAAADLRSAGRRFLTVIAVALAGVVVAVGVVVILLIVQVRQIERSSERDAHNHRVRNEDIHACIVAKEDAFRRDVQRLLQTAPGTRPSFPESDGITCPAINP